MNQKNKAPINYLAGKYDVIVVGAGHAGCEAALASARMGAKTLLLTITMDAVALTACNPSLGGPAKGVLIREIDALGGAMAKIVDRSQIQVRLLNTGKGPAVQALRAQIDKPIYQQSMLHYMQRKENLDLRQAEVTKLLVENNQVKGVEVISGGQFLAPAVILTTGTYLAGEITIGEAHYHSGPAGFPGSQPLAESLSALGLPLVRFKTGTPARVDKRSLDFSKMKEQPGDENPPNFSIYGVKHKRPRMSCWLTYTNQKTHDIINNNIERCPLFSGTIKGVGPRYCPSLEDKVVRFPHREAHPVFLEPEGQFTHEYYVQGMSTSMPEDIQIEFMKTVPGLENVQVIRPAYAIEYDCFDPLRMDITLQSQDIVGLFAAGQINGSSGYEEAAVQGLWAGANAVLWLRDQEPFFLNRAQAYTGVLVDDLVTKGVKEPYRMFTSLAEYRLLLRQDNADLRLTEIAYKHGLVGEAELKALEKKQEQIEKTEAALNEIKLGVKDQGLVDLLAKHNHPAPKRNFSIYELLRRPQISYDDLAPLADLPKIADLTAKEIAEEKAVLAQKGLDQLDQCSLEEAIDDEANFAAGIKEATIEKSALEQVILKAKYQGYIDKQKIQVKRFAKLENKILPEDINYEDIRGLSSESKQKLAKVKPQSIGQASRITGVSPADISVLLLFLEQNRRKRKANAKSKAKK